VWNVGQRNSFKQFLLLARLGMSIARLEQGMVIPTMQQTITTIAIRMTATEIPAMAPVERPPADLVSVCTCKSVCIHCIH